MWCLHIFASGDTGRKWQGCSSLPKTLCCVVRGGLLEVGGLWVGPGRNGKVEKRGWSLLEDREGRLGNTGKGKRVSVVTPCCKQQDETLANSSYKETWEPGAESMLTHTLRSPSWTCYLWSIFKTSQGPDTHAGFFSASRPPTPRRLYPSRHSSAQLLFYHKSEKRPAALIDGELPPSAPIRMELQQQVKEGKAA